MPSGDQPGGRTKTYVRLYVCTYVRSCARSSCARRVDVTHRNRYVRTRERTYVSSSPFAAGFTCVCTYVRILPEAPGGAEWYVRAYYRARAAKHHGKYVLTVSFTYVPTYVPGRTVRTCVPTYPRNVPLEVPRYLTVSLTYVRTYLHVRTYRFTHTHLRTVRTVSPSHCTGGVSLLSCIPSAARTGQRRS